MYNDESVA